MSNPKHNNPTGKNRVAHAPYNFVPLPEEIKTIGKPPEHDRYHAGLLTGKFTCTLTTASPLYVRAARTLIQYNRKNNKDESDPETPSDFFYGEEEKLLIPGSSLRGMLRNMVEIVSASRLEPVSDDPLVYRAVGDTTSLGDMYRKRLMHQNGSAIKFLMRAGFMRQKGNSDWEIIPAKEVVDGTTFGRIEQSLVKEVGKLPEWKDKQNANTIFAAVDGIEAHTHNKQRRPVDLLYARVTSASSTAKPSYNEFVLVKTGQMNNKHMDFVFGLPDAKAQPIFIPEKVVDRYKEQITLGQNDLLKSENGVLRNDQPVFYITDKNGQVEFFGHPMMFRLPYEHSPARMLPQSLQDAQGLDLAQALFGTVPLDETKGQTIAGRLFVGDAFLVGKLGEALLDETTLKILSGPKPTTFQHYLTQESPDYEKQLGHYNSNPEKEAALRGHKLYWHQGEVAKEDYAARPADVAAHPKQYSPAIKPVKSGTAFTFSIHFENLRPEELGALLWVLEKAVDPKYRLKIGMGKPYGLGSVAITHALTLTDRAKRYGSLLEGDKWNEGGLDKEANAKTATEARRAFARFVCGDANASIDDQKRIQEFLALLNWLDHPGKDDTKYMELGEFTGNRDPQKNPKGLGRRPVLPLASAVIDTNWYNHLPPTPPSGTGGHGMPHGSQSHGRSQDAPEPASQHSRFDVPAARPKQAPPTRRERPMVQTKKPAPVEKPPAKLKHGDAIWATVQAVEGQEVYLVPKVGDVEDLCHMADKGVHRFKEGEQVRVIVEKVTRELNNWLIECSSWE
jgi:CRISPR-associated protein (TIGR03986 family)